ncbi:MAG: hypothetical protein ACRD8Z_23045 [Nitrososphaeraceae archaeon]
MTEEIKDEFHNLGLDLGKLVDELSKLTENNPQLQQTYNLAYQIKDKYNSLMGDLVEFARKNQQ